MKPALAVLLLLVSGAATQGRESLCQDCEILPSNPFTSNKCINGVLAWNGTVYNCRCHNTSWTGTACDERPWWWNETLNEAEKKCVNGYQNWKSECVCYSAWTGRRCDVRRCVNGILSWSQEDRNMSCRCDKNWEGPACDQRPFWWQDALQTRPPNPGYQRCMNGYRTGSFGRQICECYSGWTGEECAIRQGRLENKTSNIPCYNGNIQYRFGVARCACYTAWRGAACDEMECLHGFFNYNNTCECFDGFAGWNCDHCESPYDSYPSCARPWYKTVLRALKTAAEWTLDRLRTVNWVYVVIILFVALIAYKMLRRSLIKAMKDRDAKQCRAVANVAPPAYNEGCNRGHTFVNPNYETELLIDCSNEIVQPTIHATLPRPWLSV